MCVAITIERNGDANANIAAIANSQLRRDRKPRRGGDAADKAPRSCHWDAPRLRSCPGLGY